MDRFPGGDRSPVAWQTYLPRSHRSHLGSELSAEGGHAAPWIADTRGDPFNASRGYLLAAWNLRSARPLYAPAVAVSGTAVEVLVLAALRAAASIKGYDATKLGNVLDGPFASRLKTHFAPFLGTRERAPLSSSDRLGEWWQGYSLRNDAVHRGVDLRSRRPYPLSERPKPFISIWLIAGRRTQTSNHCSAASQIAHRLRPRRPRPPTVPAVLRTLNPSLNREQFHQTTPRKHCPAGASECFFAVASRRVITRRTCLSVPAPLTQARALQLSRGCDGQDECWRANRIRVDAIAGDRNLRSA